MGNNVNEIVLVGKPLSENEYYYANNRKLEFVVETANLLQRLGTGVSGARPNTRKENHINISEQAVGSSLFEATN